MQEARDLSIQKQLILSSLVAWTAMAIASPSRVARYDFRHFAAENSLTISFSRSSPPLAILEDERLTVVRTEPLISNNSESVHGATRISAGTKRAWSRLRHYAKLFRYDTKGQRLHGFATRSRQVHAQRNTLKPHQPYFARLSPIEELTRLVQPVVDTDSFSNGFTRADYVPSRVRTIRLAAAHIMRSRLTPSVYRTRVQPTTTGTYDDGRRFNVREDAERPLTAPEVPRGLPRGEEAPPVVIQEDHVGMNSTPPAQMHLFKPVAEENSTNLKKTDDSTETAQVAAPALAPTNNMKRMPASWTVAQAEPLPQRALTSSTHVNTPATTTTTQAATKQQGASIYAFDGGHADRQRLPQQTSAVNETTQPDTYTIIGQVELTGGLAATGYTTKLNIQWKTGAQTRNAVIDYSSGQFEIKVPTLAAGKVIATLVDDTGRELGRGYYDLDGVAAPGQRILEGLDIPVITEETKVKGQIVSAYSVDNAFVPVTGAEVFGPAQSREAADDKGYFSLTGVNTDATLLMDSYATDYWGTRVIASGSIAEKIPLFSDTMIQSFLSIVGVTGDTSDYGIVWGMIKHKGKPVAGAQVNISTAGTIGPIYFNELRIPDKNLAATSSNGLYAFVKVKPGLDVVMAQYRGHELPSTVVSVSPSMVSYSEISFKKLEIMGRVFDPVANQNIPAQISVVGASQTARSTSQGFNLKIPSSDPVIFVEANAGPAYMVSREAIPRKGAHEINMMAYRKDWIEAQLSRAGLKYSESKGTLIGFIDGPQFNVRLDDASDPQASADSEDQNVVYFNDQGVPDPSLNSGVAGGGVFMMANLKPGLHTLVVTSASGEMVSSRLFVSEGGILNVLSMPLRP